MSQSHTSSLSSSPLSSWSRTSSMTLASFEPIRRMSSNLGYTSAGIAMTRTNSSSYISDEDLLMPDVVPEPSNECLAPSYDSTDDAYKQRKAAQEQLRKQARAQCVVFEQKKRKKSRSSSSSTKT